MPEPSAVPPSGHREPDVAQPPPAEHHHFLVQAPVPAVDADGVRVVSVGTTVFAVASVVLVLLLPRLEADGRGWWLAVAVSGFLLGLVGLLYCWRRVHRRP